MANARTVETPIPDDRISNRSDDSIQKIEDLTGVD